MRAALVVRFVFERLGGGLVLLPRVFVSCNRIGLHDLIVEHVEMDLVRYLVDSPPPAHRHRFIGVGPPPRHNAMPTNVATVTKRTTPTVCDG
jgi:hypothetical protein